MALNPGVLRTLVGLWSPGEGRDRIGGVTETWAHIDDVWARIVPLRGQERYAAQMVRPETSHRVELRYRSDVKPSWELRWNDGSDDRVLKITGVLDVEERQERLQLECVEER